MGTEEGGGGREEGGEKGTWMRAERDAGAGEGRRWRGCLAVMVCPVVVDKRSKVAIRMEWAGVSSKEGNDERRQQRDDTRLRIFVMHISCTSHAYLMRHLQTPTVLACTFQLH